MTQQGLITALFIAIGVIVGVPNIAEIITLDFASAGLTGIAGVGCLIIGLWRLKANKS